MSFESNKAPYSIDPEDYPGALMLETIHFDGSGRDQYLRARGVHMRVPLYQWMTELGQMAAMTPVSYFQPGTPMNTAMTLIKADPDLPQNAQSEAMQALYHMDFENTKYAAYVPRQNNE